MTDTTLHDCRVVDENFLRNSVYATEAILVGFAPDGISGQQVREETVNLIATWTNHSSSPPVTDWPNVLKIMSLQLSDGLQFGNWPWNRAQPSRRKVG